MKVSNKTIQAMQKFKTDFIQAESDLKTKLQEALSKCEWMDDQYKADMLEKWLTNESAQISDAKVSEQMREFLKGA